MSFEDEKCVQMLSEAKWPELTRLSLHICSLQGPGCEWIAKAKWPRLNYLNLGK